MKVLDNEWHHIHYEGKVYVTGEVLDIKDKDFKPEVFVKVGEEEPKHTGGPSTEADYEETGAEVSPPEPVSEEPKHSKVSRRKTKF